MFKFFVGFLLMCLPIISFSNVKNGTLNIIAGKNFNQPFKFGAFSFTTTPQMVLWVESEDGKFKKTVWMTRRFAKQDWVGEKYDPNKTFREYSFPRWMLQFKDVAPTKNKQLPDAVSGASPKSNAKIKVSLPNDRKLILFFEVNNSFDENEFYPNEKLYNGQPSLIYTETLEPNFKGIIELKLKYKTTLDGKLIENLEGITTASNILNKVELIVE